MQYVNYYQSPLGQILLAADDSGLTGLWFEQQKYYAAKLGPEHIERELPVFAQAKEWLDIYFAGQEPDFMPSIHMLGSPFQIKVWQILTKIPYGQTTTYGEIAQKIAQQQGLSHMSPQAVGGAVGRNRVSLIIPCHRVVGANGSLTGYAGGLERKVQLLTLENVDLGPLFRPTRGTAL